MILLINITYTQEVLNKIRLVLSQNIKTNVSYLLFRDLKNYKSKMITINKIFHGLLKKTMVQTSK